MTEQAGPKDVFASMRRQWLNATSTTTNHRAAAPFIGVLRVRDGKIAGWREYQDVPAIQRALAVTGSESPRRVGSYSWCPRWSL
jgi:ketosteroid isomerase-like protein